jgi:hypothetical protein
MKRPQNGNLLVPSRNHSNQLTVVTLVKEATMVKLVTTGIVNVCGSKVKPSLPTPLKRVVGGSRGIAPLILKPGAR